MPQPRVPTAKLSARGAFLKHPERERARKDEPKATGELGEPPTNLDREEKAAWLYVASLLPPGVAANRDRIAMEEIACLLVSCRRKRATSAERNLLRGYLRDFGMTPADSSRVTASQPEKPKNDPWDRVQSPKLQ
jgi:hypothetical protein